MIDECYVGDVSEGLRAFAAAGIRAQTCVTSPPYWGLRQYLFDGAMSIRRDLGAAERKQVEAELARLGVKPRS